MKRMLIRQAGLTLIEMLLALAIASLLLIATLRVIRTASRCSAASRIGDKNAPARTQLKRLLTMDILHADSYRQMSDGVEMKLRSCLDKKNFGLKHNPSIVAYRIRQINGKNWLVRTQRKKTEIWRELVGLDVTKITIDTPQASINYETWQEISKNFALNIQFSTANKLPMRVNCIFK